MESGRVHTSLPSLHPETTHEKIRRVITWLRTPLSGLGLVALAMFIHTPAVFWAALPCVIAGELIQCWASAHLNKNTVFTVSGPYSYVRNPMYMGRFLLVLGFILMTQSVSLLVTYLVLYPIYAHFRVRREEKRLHIIFAPAYQQYCAEVKRWMPRSQRYSGAMPRRASWTQFCINNEHLNVLALAIVLGLVYIRVLCLPEYYWQL